ncbi:unnamed protein product [Acanthoscelides obtectus]|uniref:Uncharacterized protein n=1 Tax=Acanthoscelides obtectus TaxID=200917 RepID=A0A9P0QEY2_ACAOB|nr:unnamed protein product [Acanthoscelides obtectus]CAK1627604.1 hypothetical protein AOBTE_LOCUS4699 [Acanthoscelides obtectus]
MIVIPKPQFLSKKPKYPAPISSSNLYIPNKDDRKLRIEAEHRACVKEAEASRSAIANLTKEIVSAPHANTFIIDETCSETTVENFISHPTVGFGAGFCPLTQMCRTMSFSRPYPVALKNLLLIR